MRDTIGDLATGTSTSGNFKLSAGYRAIDDSFALSFTLLTQDFTTRTFFTAFSNSSMTVTVASTTNLAVGDHIAVVENQGFSQRVAVGKILSIAGSVVTVDGWAGGNPSISSSPSGNDDFVFRLSGTTVPFGTIVLNNSYTAVTMPSVLSTGSTGYTVYVSANTNLQSVDANTITNVSDGAVTPGFEEYGISTTGTTALLTGSDFAITSSTQGIQTRSGPTLNAPDRTAVTYKLAISAITPAGTYTQDVMYTLTLNY